MVDVNFLNLFIFSLNTFKIYIVDAGDYGSANYIDEIY